MTRQSLKKLLPKLKFVWKERTNPETGKLDILTKKQMDHALAHFPDDTPLHERRRAAVLVPLCTEKGVASILFTLRSSHMNTHASEISFPGGHVEGKESHVETALRETKEELLGNYQFDNYTTVIGEAGPVPAKSGVMVSPIFATLDQDFQEVSKVFPGDPKEVESVFAVSVQELLVGERSEELQRMRGLLAPVFDTKFGKVWGLTAIMLRPILHKVIKPSLSDVETIKQGHRASML